MTKISPQIGRLITSLMVIVVLFIPTYVISEVEQRTTDRVLTFEGLYVNGTTIHIRPINKTEVGIAHLNEVIIGSANNNDSYIFSITGWLPSTNEIYYGNWVTYSGNGTYIINYDKNEPPFILSSTGFGWRLYIPLAINGTTISEYDFIRVIINGFEYNNPVYLAYWQWPPWVEISERHLTPMDADNAPSPHTKIYPLGYVERTELTKMKTILGYEYDLYLRFDSAEYIPASKHFDDGNFTFKIEGFNFTDEHSFYWSDEQLVYMSLGGGIALMVLSAAFTTNLIDIKVDRQKRRKK